jgi:erythromycin esterase
MKKTIISFLFILPYLFLSCESNPTKTEEPLPGTNDYVPPPKTVLNLSFEQTLPDNSPKNWYLVTQGSDITVQKSDAVTGKNCLKMVCNYIGNWGNAISSFPIEEAIGKHLKIKGYIKSSNITEGNAAYWLSVYAENNIKLASDRMENGGAKGTKDWTEYETEVYVDTNAVYISFGTTLVGNGTAWFDEISFEIDGESYEPELLFDVNDTQLNWLKTNVDVFDFEEPGSGVSDLLFLYNYIGNKRIVSLGEGTHGTREFFKIKHRIIEFLAHAKNFTLFGIEANMPECRAINRYVLYGEGNIREALDGIYFWTWNTEEVLAMIEWMREYNSSGAGQIQFFGFDLQTAEVAMENVLEFIALADPGFLSSATSSYDTILTIIDDQILSFSDPTIEPNYSKWIEMANRVLNHLINNKSTYILTIDPLEVDWMIQDARVVLQAASADLRDQYMADNVDWILQHSPSGSKIILWAHNGHVGKRSGQMGDYLFQQHGNDMIVFGQCFHEGTYTARGDQGIGTYNTAASSVGSFEWTFYRTGFPKFMLDLEKVSASDSLSSWLTQPLDFRNIGARSVDYAFFPTIVTDLYDALIYFEHSNPTVLLH